MLEVKVLLHPFGDKGRTKEIASMDIYNDLTGSSHYGNYVAMTYRNGTDTIQRSTTIQDYSRLSKHVWQLVREALEGMGYE